MPLSRICCVIFLWLLYPSAFLSQSNGKESTRASHTQIRFNDHLKISSDLMFSGTGGSRSFVFYMEPAWKPLQDTALRLFFQHSPNLDDNRSFLSIRLNYGILRSLRLDQHNQRLTEVVIPLPVAMLKEENELVLSVEQFSANQERPAATWTSISVRSFIDIQYRTAGSQLDLSFLPLPLLNKRSYQPKRLSLLQPEQPSNQTLEAIALIVAYLSNHILPDSVSVKIVKSLQNAVDPLLVVGTPEEQPDLQLLQGRASFVIHRENRRTLVGLSSSGPAAESDGIAGLATMSDSKQSPILFLTGNSPSAVLKATKNLIVSETKPSGTLAVFSQDAKLPQKAYRGWKGHIPPASRFTLEELGIKDLSFTAARDFVIHVPLKVTPDAHFLSYGHEMSLYFGLNMKLKSPDSRLALSFNEASLGNYTIDDISRGATASVSVGVPPGLLRHNNLLKIAWKSPAPIAAGDVPATLLSSSEFYLPRDYRLKLPDLSLLRFQLYPFSLRPDLSETFIILPDEPGGVMISSLVELACHLGRLLPTDSFAFRVVKISQLTNDHRASANLIFLEIDQPVGGAGSEVAGFPLLPLIQSSSDLPKVQEAISPWNSRRYMLRIRASSPTALRQAVALCFSDKVLGQLKGDAAYLTSDRPVCMNASKRQEIDEVSYLAHLEAWLRVNWMALPIILTIVSSLLFVGLRLLLTHYKRNRDTAVAFREIAQR